jgi:hypothetical protein
MASHWCGMSGCLLSAIMALPPMAIKARFVIRTPKVDQLLCCPVTVRGCLARLSCAREAVKRELLLIYRLKKNTLTCNFDKSFSHRLQ